MSEAEHMSEAEPHMFEAEHMSEAERMSPEVEQYKTA